MDQVADLLVEEYGTPTLGNFRSPVKEITYILLSARTTEKLYRDAQRALWRRYPTVESLSKARLRDVFECVKVAGLGKKRAKHVRECAKTVVDRFGNRPKKEMASLAVKQLYEFLVGLPGLGPKSALCVLMYSFDEDVFPVDTHVKRVMQRMGIRPRMKKHYQAQGVLPSFVPDGRSKELHVALVVHGRRLCTPRKPHCDNCPLVNMCATGKLRVDSAE